MKLVQLNGALLFFHTPFPPYRKHRPASFNWGKTPTAKFSITSQWEFSSTWVASYLAQSSQPHWRVFCWLGECLDGEEGSGKPTPEWNRKRNTCICNQCSWACSQAHVATRPSKAWSHIQWSGQVNSLQYACFCLHKWSRAEFLRRDCWDPESTSVEVSFSVPEAIWQCPYC